MKGINTDSKWMKAAVAGGIWASFEIIVVSMLHNLHKTREPQAKEALEQLKLTASRQENIFESLMKAAKSCSIGQITNALFEVGGQYRRNM
jgi:methylmalonyl-CoA mutase